MADQQSSALPEAAVARILGIRKALDEDVGKTVAELPLPDGIEEFWITITLKDGWGSRCLVTRPKAAGFASHGSKKYPLVVYFFGGGFIVGNPSLCTRPAREWAAAYGAIVVSPDYKLRPEHAFPTGVTGAWEVLMYLAHNAERELGATLQAPGGGFIVGGASAGANLAAVTAWVHEHGVEAGAIIEPSPKPITGVMLVCPVVLTGEIVPDEHRATWSSLQKTKDTEDLQRNMINYGADIKSIWFSPVNQPPSNLTERKSVPYFFQVGSLDTLVSHSVVYEKILASQGYVTKIDVLEGVGHDPWLAVSKNFSDKPNLALSEASTMGGMQWLLKSSAGNTLQ